jgi:hypothetical protein
MADRTFLRCIGRIHKNQRHTGYDCLICQKLSELSEAPRRMITSLSLRNRCPGPDSLKIFKGHQGTGVFGLRDQILGDTMNVLGKPSHPTRELLKMPLGALGSASRESSLESIISDLSVGICLPITIYSNVLDSEVNADNIYRVIGRFFRRFYYDAEVEDVLDQNKVSLASDIGQPVSLVISYNGRYDPSYYPG